MKKERTIIDTLQSIHAALDEGLGDTDITHLTDEELRRDCPIQWATERLAVLLNHLKGGITEKAQ